MKYTWEPNKKHQPRVQNNTVMTHGLNGQGEALPALRMVFRDTGSRKSQPTPHRDSPQLVLLFSRFLGRSLLCFHITIVGAPGLLA